MGAIEQLEQQVREIVDYRTEFGKTAVARVQNLAGARIPALRNLIAALKQKGISRLDAPLKFKLVGYERAGKHETIGKSIANPKLRTVYRYSLHTSDTRQEIVAGQVVGVGQVGTLGEIEVGGTLKDEFPIFFPVFGDDRYEEFFSSQGREKRRSEGTEKVRKTMDELAIEQLQGLGVDVSGLKDYLREFFLEAARLDRGSDLLWLQRQFENDKIQDNTLATAYFDVMQNPDYSNDSACLVGNAVIELRKRNAKGLIGRLREDLLFLDENRDVYDPGLDRKYTRRVYYPERKTTAEGTLRDKLGGDFITFAEALGIVRMVPGIEKAKAGFNRQNAEKYFGEGYRHLKDALGVIDPVLEADKKAHHKAKQSGSKANLQLGKNYGIANEVDVLSRLDDSRTRAANLLSFVGFKDSERIFSGIYTLGNQLRLADASGDSVQFAGVMATNYVNDIDFRDRHGLDLDEILLRMSDVEEILVEAKPVVKPKAKKTLEKKNDKKYSAFRENLVRLTQDGEFNLVNVDFEVKLVEYGQILAGYRENKGEVRANLDRLVKFAEAVDLQCGIDLQRLSQRKYLGNQEIGDFEAVRAQLKTTKEFERLRARDVVRLGDLRKKVEEKLGEVGKERSVYICERGSLRPAVCGFFAPYTTIKDTNIRYFSLGELEGRAKLVDRCKTGAELGAEFLDKLKAVRASVSGKALSTDRSYRVGNLDLVIEQLRERADDVLIANDFAAEVDVAYGKIQEAQPNTYLRYAGYMDAESLSQLGTGRAYQVVATSNVQGELQRTFGRGGGIGCLFYDSKKGWHQTRIGRAKLLEMMDKIAQRNPQVKIEIKKID
ncbi:MAG: hypothetical protein PHF67_04340 [Candidatus Nanoarchaeia archaeon]|nr:hypothetical protein [Candidatus Nanoarchaeia archaeon]